MSHSQIGYRKPQIVHNIEDDKKLMTEENNASVWVVLADIHANYVALERVWKDAVEEAAKIGVSAHNLRCISLGDVVDYGPHPIACLEWVVQHCEITLRGNHDLECSRSPSALPAVRRVSREFWPMTVWTRCQLQAAGLQQTLYDWPPTLLNGYQDLPGVVLAHADYNGNGDQSLIFDPQRPALIYEQFFVPIKTSKARVGLVGHSHYQCMFQHIPEKMGKTCILLRDDIVYSDAWQSFPEPDGSFFLINPGSVGQPRSLDPSTETDRRAKYLLLDMRDGQAQYKFRRVPYSQEEVAVALDREVVLPDPLPDSCTGGEAAFVPFTPNQTSALYYGLERQRFRLKLALGIES